MNVTTHQEKEKKGKRGAGEKKRENKRPILEKLCAALLRSFRGQHSEEMKGSARGNWNPWKVQQPFRPNPNGVGDRTTTLRRLLIGAVEKWLRSKVDKWLRSNKLSLNYKKSSYFVINKFPQYSIDIDLEISPNNIKISRSKYVQYLGLWLDDDLKFHTHIQRLEINQSNTFGKIYWNVLPNKKLPQSWYNDYLFLLLYFEFGI